MKPKKIIKVNETLDKEYKIPCIKCENTTYHKVLSSINEQDSFDEMYLNKDHEIISCMGCREITFRSNSVFSEDEEYDEDGDLRPVEHINLFPGRILGRKILKDSRLLPSEILNIYKETYITITSDAPILASVGIRALVEAICKDKEAKGHNLEEKIDNLVDLNVLTKEGVEVLHSTRIMGNKSIHDLTPLSRDDLNIAMDFVEHILLGCYILPKKTENLPKRSK